MYYNIYMYVLMYYVYMESISFYDNDCIISHRKKTVRSYKLGPLLDESDNAIVLSELTEPILKNTNQDLESTFTR